MKQYFVSTIAIVVMLGGSVTPALADNGGLRGFFDRFRSERRDDSDREEDRQSVRQEYASKSQELRLRLQETRDAERRERLKKFWDKAVERLTHLIGRGERLSVRIAERLLKFGDAGKDVSEQRVLLHVADERITDAGNVLTEADTEMSALFADSDATVSDLIAALRRNHRRIVDAIRAAHQALVDVIISTRGMSMALTPEPSAATTP